MRSLLEAGFVFWGLFLVFGLIVVGYLVWMKWVERADGPENADRRGPAQRGPPGP